LAGNATDAWFVSFAGGTTSFTNVNLTNNVLCVR
jgi:hypothetical protein